MNEIEIIKGILRILGSYEVFPDNLPDNYDLNKSNGYYYSMPTISDEGYKDALDLQIHCIGKSKIDLIKQSENIDKLLNKAEPTAGSWIVRKNIRRNYLKEDDNEHHFILEYYVINLEV